jgi:cathepsin E
MKATGAVLDKATRLPRISSTQYENLQSLFFVIGNSTFELTPNAQLWPRARNSALGGDANSIYLAINDLGKLNPGVNFMCGMTFLERFYSVFDTGNHRVGLATTPFTNATTN